VLDERGQVVHFDEYGGYLGMFSIESNSSPAGWRFQRMPYGLPMQPLSGVMFSLRTIFSRSPRKISNLPENLTIADLACRNAQLWILDATARYTVFDCSWTNDRIACLQLP